jgi:hypothetical protein
VERVLVTPTHNRATERLAAARRRRVLSVLVILTFVVGVGWLLGFVPLFALAGPFVAIAGFLAVARRSVRQANKPYWVELAPPEQTSGVVVRRSAVRVDASSRDGSDQAAWTDDVDEREDEEPTITLTAAQRKVAAGLDPEPPVAVTSTQTPDGGSLWDPLPVTLPTYVGAPVAMRTFRTIELGEPGTWSSGHSTEDSRTVASAAREPAVNSADDNAARTDDEVTEEVPRVVNG